MLTTIGEHIQGDRTLVSTEIHTWRASLMWGYVKSHCKTRQSRTSPICRLRVEHINTSLSFTWKYLQSWALARQRAWGQRSPLWGFHDEGRCTSAFILYGQQKEAALFGARGWHEQRLLRMKHTHQYFWSSHIKQQFLAGHYTFLMASATSQNMKKSYPWYFGLRSLRRLVKSSDHWTGDGFRIKSRRFRKVEFFYNLVSPADVVMMSLDRVAPGGGELLRSSSWMPI